MKREEALKYIDQIQEGFVNVKGLTLQEIVELCGHYKIPLENVSLSAIADDYGYHPYPEIDFEAGKYHKNI